MLTFYYSLRVAPPGPTLVVVVGVCELAKPRQARYLTYANTLMRASALV